LSWFSIVEHSVALRIDAGKRQELSQCQLKVILNAVPFLIFSVLFNEICRYVFENLIDMLHPCAEEGKFVFIPFAAVSRISNGEPFLITFVKSDGESPLRRERGLAALPMKRRPVLGSCSALSGRR
jgi:hypothetical protein